MEQWKPIPNYEGYYEVSDIGRVRSVTHFRKHPRNQEMPFLMTGRVRIPRYDKNGYPTITLSKEGVCKTCKIHRLVALAFIPNPNNYQTIDHINGVKYDNRVENLRWCTTQQNTKYRDEKYDVGDRAKFKVICKETNQVFNSTYNAAFWLLEQSLISNTNYKSASKGIRANCTGRYHSAYGFHWAYIKGSTTRS